MSPVGVDERAGGRWGPAAQSEPAGPAIGLPIDKADAMLPGDLLQGGEVVILILKPSAWYIILDGLGHYAAILGLTIAGWLVGGRLGAAGLDRGDVLLAGSLAMSARLVWQFLLWLSRIYVLTDRRVIRRRGVFTVVTFEAALSQVQHTQVTRLIRERLFGVGTIGFATAGTGGPEAFWEMVNQPYAVHRTVVRAINRYTNHGSG